MMKRPFSPMKQKKLLAWMIWLVTMGLVAFLWSDVGQRSPILGFAEGVEHRVAPTTPGKIQSVAVQLGQEVRAGQTLAILDPRQLDGQIRVEQAELERIKASMGAVASREQLRTMSMTRGFVQASERSSVALARARSELRLKTAQLAALTSKRKELGELLARRMVVRKDLVDLELRVLSMEKEVQAAASAVTLLKGQASSASARHGALPARSVELSMAPLKAEITVVERRLEQLEASREGLVLRSPGDGRVSAILMRKGEVAKVGQPVVSVVATSAARVIACVYENQATEVKVGMTATLYGRGVDDRTHEGQVVTLGPIVAELPPRCRPQPRQRVWGRTAVILLGDPGRLVAGQAFNVRLSAADDRAGQAVAAPLTAGDQGTIKTRAPALMTVPEALKETSRFEPSGLTWVPRLARFVVVSDDTGQKKRSDHAPWLFTMDTAGRVDPRPLEIKGVDSFNDLEAISPGPGDGLYVISSQSFSKKGKRKPSRQAFLRLTPHGKGYRVNGSVRLAELLDRASGQLRASLGLTDTRRLNIEGMTVTSAGGVLIGLKAPLDSDGRALIWHLKRPEQLFTSGRLSGAGLSLWGRVTLQAEVGSKKVPGGIAELLELPDGTLLISATASGIKSMRQSGTLWHLPRHVKTPHGGPRQARLIRTFSGRKPEGLAISPRPGQLMVVFDADQDTPSWLELPWPRQ